MIDTQATPSFPPRGFSAVKTTFLLSVALLCMANIALPAAAETPKTLGSIERVDPAFDKLVAKDAVIEVLADGFEWSEGPCWVAKGEYLLFSDIPRNRINKWKEGAGISVFMEKSGYTGKEAFTGMEPGSNGLALDSQGRLHLCAHGDRAVKRVENGGKVTVLADKYKGKRLNSPNDLAFAKNGDIYFTDPPYGLPKAYDDPARELDFCGVYRLSKDGTLTLLTEEMTRPNGIGFSPDQKTLYVAQSDPKAALWKKFAVKEDGTLGKGEKFADVTDTVDKLKGLPDGMAIDTNGNVWATAPGGVLCYSPAGKLLGKILTGEATANCKFGNDGSTLYITADMYLVRVKTKAKGLGF
jgi:gluconolactonase